jgi:hypothetical protein
MKRPLVFLVFSVLTFFCLISAAYAQTSLDAANGIGDLFYDFFAWIIQTIVSIFFAILDFFGQVIFGV